MSTEEMVGEDVAPIPSSDFSYKASELVEEYSRAYVGEIYKNHFPSEIDGFKMVFRRFLYALYDKRLMKTMMKSTAAVSELNKVHPYNDRSMYEVVMRMAQSWVFNPPLVRSPSQIGTYSGNTPADVRYTSAGVSEFARDIYIEGVDVSAIPRTEGALLDLEPSYFIPAIPMALLINNLTIGYGNGSLTARLNFGAVCDLVVAYAQYRKDNPMGVFDARAHAEKFLPDFTTPCIITNAESLTESYREGDYNAPIHMEGRVVITKDKIVVQSLPQGIPFLTADYALKDYLRANKNSSLDKKIKSNNATRSKKDLGNLTITPRQNVSTLELWREIATLIRFYGRYHPNPNYTLSDKTVVSFDYPTILARWYKARQGLLLSTKRRRLQQMTRQKWAAEAHLVIVQNPDRCIEIIRTSPDDATIIKLFKEEFNLTPFQTREVLSQNIRSLTKVSAVKIQERIINLTQQIDHFHRTFHEIGEDIANTATVIKKKYYKDRISHIPNYIGYVAFPDGNVLFENGSEVRDILDAFPKEPCQIYRFYAPHKQPISENGKFVKDDLHKYSYGDIIDIPAPRNSPDIYTVNFSNGSLCHSPGIKPARRTPGVTYTTRNVTGLTRKGKVQHFDITTTSSRINCLVSEGARSDLVHIHSYCGDFYIAQMNPEDKNVLHVQKVRADRATYVTSPIGDPSYFFSATGKDWFIIPPAQCLSRCSARVIFIPDADAVFADGKTQLRYDLNGKTRRSSGIFIYS